MTAESGNSRLKDTTVLKVVVGWVQPSTFWIRVTVAIGHRLRDPVLVAMYLDEVKCPISTEAHILYS